MGKKSKRPTWTNKPNIVNDLEHICFDKPEDCKVCPNFMVCSAAKPLATHAALGATMCSRCSCIYFVGSKDGSLVQYVCGNLRHNIHSHASVEHQPTRFHEAGYFALRGHSPYRGVRTEDTRLGVCVAANGFPENYSINWDEGGANDFSVQNAIESTDCIHQLRKNPKLPPPQRRKQ